MTNAEKLAQAIAYLKLTTVGYFNKNWKVPPAGTNWAKALALLDEIDTGVNYPTLDAFRVNLQPNNTDDGSNNHSAGWTIWHSARTPRSSLNGDPVARYLGQGDHYFIIKGKKPLAGSAGRWLNFHNVAGDPGWNGVSPIAFDDQIGIGDSGFKSEVTLEYERTQDTDTQPHSGGAHWGLPDSTFSSNLWYWFGIEVTIGGNEDGSIRVYDWSTGTKFIDVQGVNTLMPGSRLVQLWEGAYVSSGLQSPVTIEETPALFSTLSFSDALTDLPQLVATNCTWGINGGTNTTVDLGIEKVQVPVSPLVN